MNPENVYEYNWSTIERSIARIMAAKNWTREEAYRQCFSRVGTGVGTGARTGRGRGVSACVPTRMRARVLNSNCININTSVCETSAAEAATHTQPISLGGLFRQLPKRVPESYALWWWRYMKDREWQLTNGRCVTAKTWRVTLITFYNAAKSGELADAKEEYERYFGKAFPRQEETAAEGWEEKCRGCDNYWSGHCVACAMRPPKSAAECKRFKAMEGGAQ